MKKLFKKFGDLLFNKRFVFQQSAPSSEPKSKEKIAHKAKEQLKKEVEKKRRQKIINRFTEYFGAKELEPMWDDSDLDTPKNGKLIKAMVEKIKDADGLERFLDFFDEIKRVDGINAQIVIRSLKTVFKNHQDQIDSFLNLIVQKSQKNKYSLSSVLLHVIKTPESGFKFQEVIPKNILKKYINPPK